jgi:hypothetical protein
MMKKFLVLMMVLGLASMANAQLQISVNGNISGPDEITLTPSDTITLDIWNPGGVMPINFTAYLDVLFNNTGCYDLANARLGPAAGTFPASFVFNALPGNIDEYTFLQVWSTPPPNPDPAGAMFLVDFHCLSPNNVVIVNLYDSRVGGAEVIVDSLTIHQIPEPMTMALLGLGGLFLRRRK